MNVYFLYRYSLQLETEVFAGRTADYIYFFLVTGAAELVSLLCFCHRCSVYLHVCLKTGRRQVFGSDRFE